MIRLTKGTNLFSLDLVIKSYVSHFKKKGEKEKENERKRNSYD